MIRPKMRFRHRVPHGLAIVGAALLLTGTLLGVDSSTQPQQVHAGSSVSAVAVGNQAEDQRHAAESVETVDQPAVKQHKRFRVNLFLFRR